LGLPQKSPSAPLSASLLAGLGHFLDQLAKIIDRNRLAGSQLYHAVNSEKKEVARFV